jgi:cbb3-type cytochrome oxidase subunit 3
MDFTDFLWIVGLIILGIIAFLFNKHCAEGRKAGDEAARKYFEELNSKE